MSLSLETIKELTTWQSRFIEDLKLKNMSKNTISMSFIETNRFIEFCREIELEKMESIDGNLMRLYFLDIKDAFIQRHQREISNNSLNIAISRIRVFFEFISYHHDDFLDLTKAFKKIKINHKNKELKRFTQQENQKIISSIVSLKSSLSDKKPRTLQNLRMLFAISILYYGGLRSCEVLKLRKKDFIETSNKERVFYILRVVGKGEKYREVPILKSHLQGFESVFLPLEEDSLVFPFSYRALRKGVEKFERGAGISNLGNHSFRHNLATNLVGKNINMQVISDILGHSSITTTAKFYSRVRVDYKMDALAD